LVTSNCLVNHNRGKMIRIETGIRGNWYLSMACWMLSGKGVKFNEFSLKPGR